jgi:Flp pilus assembly protein TadD
MMRQSYDNLFISSEAMKAYDKAIFIDPSNCIPLNNKAMSLLADKRNNDALVTIDKALVLCPDSPEILDIKGHKSEQS